MGFGETDEHARQIVSAAARHGALWGLLAVLAFALVFWLSGAGL